MVNRFSTAKVPPLLPELSRMKYEVRIGNFFLDLATGELKEVLFELFEHVAAIDIGILSPETLTWDYGIRITTDPENSVSIRTCNLINWLSQNAQYPTEAIAKYLSDNYSHHQLILIESRLMSTDPHDGNCDSVEIAEEGCNLRFLFRLGAEVGHGHQEVNISNDNLRKKIQVIPFSSLPLPTHREAFSDDIALRYRKILGREISILGNLKNAHRLEEYLSILRCFHHEGVKQTIILSGFQRFGEIDLVSHYIVLEFISEIEDENSIIEKIMKIYYKILPYVKDIQFQLTLQYARRQSLRSAITAVMSRNMSHNLGSHVLARLSTEGIDGWTRGKGANEIVAEFTKGSREHIYSLVHRPIDSQALDNIENEFCSKIGELTRPIVYWSKDSQTFDRYLQQRMDFIAQIATEWPTWSEPTWFMRDIMRWFFTQRHLLDNIARSDGLKAHVYLYREDTNRASCEENAIKQNQANDIRFHIFMVPRQQWSEAPIEKSVQGRINQLKESCLQRYQAGCADNPCLCPDGCQTCPRIILQTPGDGTSICELKEDFLVSIPGGIVGCHAFYTILENFVRNAAKHGYARSRQNHLDVVIEILYDPEEEVGIHNTIENSQSRLPARLFRIYTNVSPVGRRGVNLKRMNEILSQRIVDEKGQRIRTNLGHAEMKIAAGYLQKRDLMHIGSQGMAITGDLNEPLVDVLTRQEGGVTIIRAVESPIGTLAYEFPVMLRRAVGIVCPESVTEDIRCALLNDVRNEWRKHSVYIMENDNDTDFEFYVYVDPEDEQKRPSFLKELYSILRGSTDFAVAKHRRELKTWIGNDAPATEVNPLNWLKIAIERYPMRLFIVDNELPADLDRFPFIKKRICWITREDFKECLGLSSERNNAQSENPLRLQLHAQWVKHLIRDVREDVGDVEYLLFAFDWDHQEGVYVPPTVPHCLRRIPNTTAEGELFILSLEDLTIQRGSFLGWKRWGDNAIRILFSRHRSGFTWNSGRKSFDALFGSLMVLSPHYSEAISGLVSYAGRLVDAHSDPKTHRRLLLLLAETALLRIGVADERFQEWWGYLDRTYVSNIFQQRITSLFWGSPNKYGQGQLPRHQFYARFRIPDSDPQPESSLLDWGTVRGKNSELLWQGQQRNLDVVILHQGILDKQFPRRPRRHLTREVLKWKNIFPWLFITSGRGKPENVPDGVKFIPFASVEACVVGNYFEKLTLLRQLSVIVETGGLL